MQEHTWSSGLLTMLRNARNAFFPHDIAHASWRGRIFTVYWTVNILRETNISVGLSQSSSWKIFQNSKHSPVIYSKKLQSTFFWTPSTLLGCLTLEKSFNRFSDTSSAIVQDFHLTSTKHILLILLSITYCNDVLYCTSLCVNW